MTNVCFSLDGQGAMLAGVEEVARERCLWRVLKWTFLNKILLVKENNLWNAAGGMEGRKVAALLKSLKSKFLCRSDVI